MASLDIEIQDITPSKADSDFPKTYVEIRDGEIRASGGVIQSPGVIIVPRGGTAGTLTQHNAIASASDIGGYRQLSLLGSGLYVTRKVTYTGSPIPTGDLPIEEYARSAGPLDGVSSNNSTTTAAVRARKVNTTGEVCKVRVEIYHRTTGGIETLLDSFTTPDLTEGTFVDFEGDVTIDQAWGTGERLVYKAIGINEGAPG